MPVITEDVTALHPGDEVFGWCTAGALAEYARVPADNLVALPGILSAVDAAAVPTSAMTALQALRDVAKVRPGQTVLVTGASGGVGSFAVQIAKALGAEVTGVCSTRNVDLVRALGADHVIDYTRTDFTGTGERYDVILDNIEAQPPAAASGRGIDAHRHLLSPRSGRGGRWVSPDRWAGSSQGAVSCPGSPRHRPRPFTSPGKRQDLLATWPTCSTTGRIRPLIDRTYPLDDAADALRHVGAGHTRGKVVVTV